MHLGASWNLLHALHARLTHISVASHSPTTLHCRAHIQDLARRRLTAHEIHRVNGLVRAGQDLEGGVVRAAERESGWVGSEKERVMGGLRDAHE
jgi:hypothetical protein